MKGSHSNRTENILKLVMRLSIASCIALTLGACETTPQPPDPATELAEPAPALPCSNLPAKELERQALELLDGGEAAAAREKLECALELDSGSSQARLLIEQLDADPTAYLGRRYFKYTVKSSETLSKIAQRYLGSSLKFVILARYNSIDVPSNLAAGQDIKIPGTKPVEAEPLTTDVAPPPPVQTGAAEIHDQALEMEQEGNLQAAYELMSRAVEEDASLENAEADLARIRAGLISKLEEDAYNQELSGDSGKAADIWRRILEIDAGNIPAQLALKRLTE